jgi:hypothetical protein
MKPGMTHEELLALPVTVDLPTAARALGLGRNKAYELARHERFPCRVLQVGRRYVVPTAELRRTLGITVLEDPPSGNGTGNAKPSPLQGPEAPHPVDG